MRWSTVFASVLLVGCVTEPISPEEQLEDVLPDEELVIDSEGFANDEAEGAGGVGAVDGDHAGTSTAGARAGTVVSVISAASSS